MVCWLKVAHTDSELEERASVIFGEGFGGITDLEVGPDGYLYVVSIGQGAIYRIVPGVNGGSSAGNGVTTDIDDDEQGEDDVESQEDNISSNDEGEADEDGNLDVDEGGGGEGDTAEAE